MTDKADLVNVKLRVIKPLGPDKQRPTHHFLAVVGKGLQLGNNDPSKGQRAIYVGDHVWERNIWVRKNTDIQYKWLVVQYYTNDIKDIETLTPRTITIGDRPLTILNRFSFNEVTITEMDCPSLIHDSTRSGNKPRKNYHRYTACQQKTQKFYNVAMPPHPPEGDVSVTTSYDDDVEAALSNDKLADEKGACALRVTSPDHVARGEISSASLPCCAPCSPPRTQQVASCSLTTTQRREQSYVAINTSGSDLQVHGENVHIDIHPPPLLAQHATGPMMEWNGILLPTSAHRGDVDVSSDTFRQAVSGELKRGMDKTHVLRTVVKTAALAGAVVAGANLIYNVYKYANLKTWF